MVADAPTGSDDGPEGKRVSNRSVAWSNAQVIRVSAGSNPVRRAIPRTNHGAVTQKKECPHVEREVAGSSPAGAAIDSGA